MIYKDLETLPIGVFDKVTRTGDLTLLVVDEKAPDNLENIWEGINEQYFEEYGIPKHIENYIEYMKEWLDYMVEIYVDGRKDLQVFADRAKKEAEDSVNGGGDFDLYDLASELSRSFGSVDPATTSVKLFMSHINNVKKHGKENNR